MAGIATLLIVDVGDDILAQLTNHFKMHWHRLTVAVDGAAMFAALERHPIDLVILDVMLPREDGFSLCKKLRAISRVPVIMLTAATHPTDRPLPPPPPPHPPSPQPSHPPPFLPPAHTPPPPTS